MNNSNDFPSSTYFDNIQGMVRTVSPKKAKQERILRMNGATFCEEHNEQAFATQHDTPKCHKCVGIKKSDVRKYLAERRQAQYIKAIQEMKIKNPDFKQEKPVTFSQRMKKLNYNKEK